MVEEEAGFIGPVDIDTNLVFGFFTRNTSAVPTDADSHPTGVTYDIYSADMASRLVTGATATDNSNETGGYYISQSIATGTFETGKLYTIVLKYLISTASRRRAFTFLCT
jgi:hypothetical protein